MKKLGVGEIYEEGFFSRVGFLRNEAVLKIGYNEKGVKVCDLG